MMKLYILLTTVIFASGSLFAQINPTSSPYYGNGIYTTVSDSTTVNSKKLVMYKPGIPPVSNKYPVLLFQPGANGIFGGTINVHTYDLYLKHLSTYGVVAIVVDEASAGFPTGTTLSNCLNWVKEQARTGSGHWLENYIDTNKIVVGGHSNGGVNACETLADYPEDVAGIVFFASYPNTFPAADVGSYTGKVLDLAGSEDESSTPAACKSGYEKFTSSACATWVQINGMGHGGFGDYVNTSQPVGTIGREPATATVRHYLVSFMLSQFNNNNTAANNLLNATARPNTTGEFETTCSAPTSLMEISGNENTVVYPNPVQNIIYVSFSNTVSEDITINLFNISGQLYKNYKETIVPGSELQIPVEDLSPGMYMIRIETRSGIFKKRIMKQ